MLKHVNRVVGVIPAAAVLGPAATGNARAPSTFELLAAWRDGTRLESVVPVLPMALVAAGGADRPVGVAWREGTRLESVGPILPMALVAAGAVLIGRWMSRGTSP